MLNTCIPAMYDRRPRALRNSSDGAFNVLQHGQSEVGHAVVGPLGEVELVDDALGVTAL